MPKCTWTPDAVGVACQPREEVLADGLDGAEGLVVDGRGARKAAAGDVQANFLPTRRMRWLAATLRDGGPSTILICVCGVPALQRLDREQREDVGHEFDARGASLASSNSRGAALFC